MAKESTSPKKPEKPVEPPPEPKPEEPRKPKNAKVVPIPLMLDFSLSVSRLMVLLVGLMTCVVSLVSGASIPMIILRGSLAMLSVGLVMWAFNWVLARNSLELARLELMAELEKMKAQQQENAPASTVEVAA